MAFRSELHKRGLRFRKDFRLDAPGVRVRPDVVFPRARVSIFIDGCFWHCCPEHMNMPKSTPDYWEPTLAATRARAARVSEALRPEERRVGKDGFIPFRSRWSTYHLKKK